MVWTVIASSPPPIIFSNCSICPFIIREDVARVYGLPISQVRVHIPELGGCFGYKSDITVEQTVAYIASFVPAGR